MRIKALIIAFLVSVVLALAMGVYMYTFYQGYVVQAAQENLQREAELIEVNISNSFGRIVSDLEVIAQLPPIQGIIRCMANDGIDPVDGSTTLFWKKRLQVIFSAFLKANNTYTQMRYVGKANEGRELVRVNQSADGELEFVSNSALQTKAHESYFKAWLMPENQKFYISDPTYNREHGVVELPRMYTVRILRGVFDKGHPFGFIVVNINYKYLLRKVLEESSVGFGVNHRVYLLNEAGDAVQYDAGQLKFYLHNNAVISYPDWMEQPGLHKQKLDDQGFFRTGNEISYYVKILLDKRLSSKYVYLITSSTVPKFFSLENKLLTNLILLVMSIFLFAFAVVFLYVRYAMEIPKDNKREEALFLDETSGHSSLTHLTDKNTALRILGYEIAKAERTQKLFSVLWVEINNIAEINKAWGDSAGHELLEIVAERLNGVAGCHKIVRRIGEYSFLVLLLDFEKKLELLKYNERYRQVLSTPYSVKESNDIKVAFSVGVSIYPEHGQTALLMLEHAEDAMHKAREAGGDDFVRLFK